MSGIFHCRSKQLEIRMFSIDDDNEALKRFLLRPKVEKDEVIYSLLKYVNYEGVPYQLIRCKEDIQWISYNQESLRDLRVFVHFLQKPERRFPTEICWQGLGFILLTEGPVVKKKSISSQSSSSLTSSSSQATMSTNDSTSKKVIRKELFHNPTPVQLKKSMPHFDLALADESLRTNLSGNTNNLEREFKEMKKRFESDILKIEESHSNQMMELEKQNGILTQQILHLQKEMYSRDEIIKMCMESLSQRLGQGSQSQSSEYNTLKERIWLDDIVINDYTRRKSVNLENICVFSTYFLRELQSQKGLDEIRLRKWVSPMKYSSYHSLNNAEILIFPIHSLKRKHWALVVVYRINGHEIIPYYLDSFYNEPEFTVQSLIFSFLNYVYPSSDFTYRKWQIVPVPRQKNEYDCGVFILHMFDLILKQNDILLERTDLHDWFLSDFVHQMKRSEILAFLKGL